jgi:hypothetical protein
MDSSQVNSIVELGWSEVSHRIRQLTQCLLYLIADIRDNRMDAIPMLALSRLGILQTDPDYILDDIVGVISGFEPDGNACLNDTLPPAFDFGRGMFLALDDDDLTQVVSQLASNWDLISDGVHGLNKPNTADPTLAQLASIYIELARYRGVASVLETAGSVDIVELDRPTEPADLFGVGESIAATVTEILSPSSSPFEATISLSKSPDFDSVVAAFVVRHTLLRSYICCCSAREDGFESGLTHIKNHCTISAGKPCHSPGKLCFDKRLLDEEVTNTELILCHLQEAGAPVEFMQDYIELAKSIGRREGKFHVRFFEQLKAVAGSLPLALAANDLFLESRFPIPDEFYKWLQPSRKSLFKIEEMPDYPKLQEPLSPILAGAIDNHKKANR